MPGAADRILKLAEGEALHRREQEAAMVRSQCQDSRLGLWLGFVIGGLALAVSALVCIFANPWAGGVLGLASIASLAGVFVYGSRQMAADRADEPEEQGEHSPK